MKKLSKDEVILRAVKSMKSSEFGVTGIKIECEAQLNRGDDDNSCSYCEGDGYTYDEDEDRIDCDNCDGSGRAGGNGGWEDSLDCHDFLLEQLVAIGLAEESDEGYEPNTGRYHSYRLANNYRPKYPLVYSKFYVDGSVDSEWTFTLALDDPENIQFLPKLIDAWNSLTEEVTGGEYDTSGAGMHMALINSEDCSYPYEPLSGQRDYFNNFAKQMNLLMPALFFLGSCDNVSRSLHYRKPGVGGSGNKYQAIHYNGALEFRLFETCYNRPETILDNVVVMAKALRFWSRERHNLSKICTQFRFGNNKGRDLERLYQDGTLIDLLNAGLRILKPDYLTIGEVKKVRGFKTTKHKFTHQLDRWTKDAHLSYKEYEYRFEWSSRELQLSAEAEVARYLARTTSTAHPATEEQFRELVERQRVSNPKQSLPMYVQEHIRKLQRDNQGEFTLSA